MDENEATRLCRDVWRQLVTSQDRVRRVQGKLRESQLNKLRLPTKNENSEGIRKTWMRPEVIEASSRAAPVIEDPIVSKEEADAVKKKLLTALSVRGVQDVKSLFKHMRLITEGELNVLVRAKLRLSDAAVSDEEIGLVFKFIDQKKKKKVPVTFVTGFLIRDTLEPTVSGPTDLDPLEALRWKRMELTKDLERLKEKLR